MSISHFQASERVGERVAFISSYLSRVQEKDEGQQTKTILLFYGNLFPQNKGVLSRLIAQLVH